MERQETDGNNSENTAQGFDNIWFSYGIARDGSDVRKTDGKTPCNPLIL
jgi:hypothetical protein